MWLSAAAMRMFSHWWFHRLLPCCDGSKRLLTCTTCSVVEEIWAAHQRFCQRPATSQIKASLSPAMHSKLMLQLKVTASLSSDTRAVHARPGWQTCLGQKQEQLDSQSTPSPMAGVLQRDFQLVATRCIWSRGRAPLVAEPLKDS